MILAALKHQGIITPALEKQRKSKLDIGSLLSGWRALQTQIRLENIGSSHYKQNVNLPSY
jgi:hypothetical protein